MTSAANSRLPGQLTQPATDNATRKRRNPIQTCREETDLIGEYLTGELDSQTLPGFETHLSRCRDCTALVQTYKKTVEATRALLRVQSGSALVC